MWIGSFVIGAAMFLVVLLTWLSPSTLVQTWHLTRSFGNSLHLSTIYLLALAIGFLAGSWSIGRALAHIIGLAAAKYRTKSAPN